MERALFGVVPEIPAEHDATRSGELHIERLMPGGVAGRELENHSAVAEDVVVAGKYLLVGASESRVERQVGSVRTGAEHEVELRLLSQPDRAGVVAGVADVVPVR